MSGSCAPSFILRFFIGFLCIQVINSSKYIYDIPIGKYTPPALGTVIGIDLGTSYSCVGVYKNGGVEIIPNDQGDHITPSWVAFTDTDTLIGEAAKDQSEVDPERTIFGVKRLIGRKFEDKEVQKHIKLVPYKIVNKDGKPCIQVKVKDGETKVFSPEEITAMILVKMKEIAEAFLEKKIEDAIITVPAYFNDAQREATKKAGVIAGLNVARFIIDTNAAAITYGLPIKGCKKNILVFDFGGKSLDVSVLAIDNDVFEVLSTNGDPDLGGEDFDQKMMELTINATHKYSTELDLSKNYYTALGKLRREVEFANMALSRDEYVYFNLSEPHSFKLSRVNFEMFNIQLFRKILSPVKKAIKNAGLKKNQIDDIVLVGGTTRIPRVQWYLETYFDHKELNKELHPDEAIAYGAAVQGAILSGEGGDDTKGIHMLDVVPLSVGIKVDGGLMFKMIPRNTVVPTKVSHLFRFYRDHETAVTFKVYEGERSLIKDCRLIGNVDLRGVPLDSGKAPLVEFTLEVDVCGVLNVTVEAKASGSHGNVIIKHDKGRIRWEKIKEMLSESEEFAEEDAKVKERIKARINLKDLATDIRSQMDHVAPYIESDQMAKVKTAVEETFRWLEDNPNTERDLYVDKWNELETIFKIALFYTSPEDDAGTSDDADRESSHDELR